MTSSSDYHLRKQKVFANPTIISCEMCKVFAYLKSVYCIPESLGSFSDEQWKNNKLSDFRLVFVQPLTTNIYKIARQLDNPTLIGSSKGFNIIRFAGLVFNVPQEIGKLTLEDWRQGKVDKYQKVSVTHYEEDKPNLLYRINSNIVQFETQIYIVPHIAGDLTAEQWRNDKIKSIPGVFTKLDTKITSNFREENILDLSVSNVLGKTIEYPGHHKLFDQIGACGTHPQFRHLSYPPKGYKILPSEAGQSLYTLEMLTLLWKKFRGACISIGASVDALEYFIETRPLHLQEDIGCKNADFVFYPSVPLHIGQRPWVIEIEDTTTLFFPFLNNGKTSSINDIRNSDYYPIIKSLVEADTCKAIITHVKSTAESLQVLFDKELISKKVFHIPMGISAPNWDKVQSKKNHDKLSPRFLISNSWHQNSSSFYLRGGLESILAFSQIKTVFPNAKLTIRAKLPEDLPETVLEVLKNCDVQVIDSFLPLDEWEILKLRANFFLIPSARIHIVSMLEAMAYGMILVASDGWAINEYATDGHDAILVKGRSNISYIDWDSGILCENYSPMFRVNEGIVQQIVVRVTSLILHPAQQKEMRRKAWEKIDHACNMETFNFRLKKVFDSFSYDSYSS
jgi:glycosyltransferase involved in cell wall biosynthesis